ncbi:CsbD family protein [Legionella spiritensis]|uniref:CsbD family protein n=1 Tax=Legionella spiritensis TaxID=452 RepID=UPI000F6E112F|nr:hypothetical protein [Legionella spiritensis]VEG91094.1 General stress response protein [Legionella spiritensis]
MRKDIFQGNWKEIERKIKHQWSKLTEDDLIEIKKDNRAIYSKLEQHYGYTRGEIEEQLKRYTKH